MANTARVVQNPIHFVINVSKIEQNKKATVDKIIAYYLQKRKIRENGKYRNKMVVADVSRNFTVA